MNNNYIKDDTIEKYPKIKGKYKAMFGIPHTLLPKLHKEIYDLYSTSHLLKLIDPKSVHKIITNFFINEYYPVMSKKFNTNDKTAVIIMGTVGFNMNIPKNLGKLVFTKTEDIDLKIYTTELCYNKSKNNTNVVKSIISLFKYMVIMICMFIKQIIAEILDFSKNIFINTKSNIKKKYSKNKSYSFKNNSISNFKSTVKKNKKSNKIDLEGNKIKLINNNKKNFGLLHNASMYIIIKKGVGKDYIDEKINITNLSYEETYNILQEKINDIDLLITSKIKYNMHYSKLIKTTYNKEPLTFSDSKIYYPNLLENPTFYSYYLLNNKDKNKDNNLTLDNLYNKHININEIIDLKKCGKNYNNNCNYISKKSLELDLILMLQYADFLNDENNDNYNDNENKNINILVPIGSLFKYIKYFIKYLRLSVITKYNNKTLKTDYVDTYKKLCRYIDTKLLNKTIRSPETATINIDYKKSINDFHQAFFIKQTMFPEYEIFKDIVDNFNNIKLYINKSRLLFKDVYEKYIKVNNMDNNITLLNILPIIYKYEDDKDNKDNKVGGYNKKINYILYSDINDDLNDDLNDIINDKIYKLSLITKYKYTKNKKNNHKKLITKKIKNKDKTNIIIENIKDFVKADIKNIENIKTEI